MVAVIRRVGIKVEARVPVIVSVARTVPVSVPLIVGAGLVRSTVGVSVGVSRVGMGACVGVAISVPRGRLMSVGGPIVADGAVVGITATVGVAGRGNDERIIALKSPAQYKTLVAMKMTPMQPYVI